MAGHRSVSIENTEILILMTMLIFFVIIPVIAGSVNQNSQTVMICLMFLLILLLFLNCVTGGRWMLMGGYSGVEGDSGTSSIGEVELLTLNNEERFNNDSSWCQKNLTSSSLSLDGATINMINEFEFVRKNAYDPRFTGPHYSIVFQRALVCGGGNSEYSITNNCSWWLPENNAWLEGPKMFSPRYRAAVISRDAKVWMLGGREGSQILQDNEVLLFPGSFAGTDYDIRSWEWAHKKMKNILVWENVVPEGMKKLPIPLTGHCAVIINDRYVLVIGGATLQTNPDGSFVAFSRQEISNHVHLYDFSKDTWASTVTNSQRDGKALNKIRIPRMNHACVTYEENGATKVMIVGGVSKDSLEDSKLEKTAEILDFENLIWTFAPDLPRSITGSRIILTDGRPTLVGRYGDERQQKMLRYSLEEKWEDMPLKLLHGRSDFQILSDFPRLITIYPKMSSHTTKMNPGTCAPANWRNLLGLIEHGKKTIFRTNYQQQPWIQLDLGQELLVVNVSISEFNKSSLYDFFQGKL